MFRFTFAKKLGLDFKTLTPKIGWLKEEESGGGSATISPLDRPLPWDHINSGVDKGWLRDELMKALSETLTPDCAFHECSSCGVCGDAFGNNVVIPPPPIPEFQGHYRYTTAPPTRTLWETVLIGRQGREKGRKVARADRGGCVVFFLSARFWILVFIGRNGTVSSGCV